MKLLLLGLAALLVVAMAAMAARAPAQEVPPDENLLVMACDYVQAIAAANGFEVTNCRRVAEEVNGNRAIETISVRLPDRRRVALEVSYQRSLWGSPVIVEK